MDSISVPISNASLAIGSYRDGNQDQGSPSSTADCINELENEIVNAVPWTCPNRLKVVLGRIAMKVQKDKPTMGKMMYFQQNICIYSFYDKFTKNC